LNTELNYACDNRGFLAILDSVDEKRADDDEEPNVRFAILHRIMQRDTRRHFNACRYRLPERELIIGSKKGCDRASAQGTVSQRRRFGVDMIDALVTTWTNDSIRFRDMVNDTFVRTACVEHF